MSVVRDVSVDVGVDCGRGPEELALALDGPGLPYLKQVATLYTC